MNQIVIEGNLGSDPELKVFGDETLATFSLAHTPRKKVNNQWQDGDTIWFRVTFWNTKADNVLDTLRKGEKVLVAGKLAQSKFCLLYTSPSPRDRTRSRMPSSA